MNNPYPSSEHPSPQNHTQPYPPWSGDIHIPELLKSPSMLIAALVSCAVQRGHRMEQLAKALGISNGYLGQLRSGQRPVDRTAPPFSGAAAKYLGIPRASALMLAELPLEGLKEEDLLEANALPVDQVRQAMEAIAEDNIYGPLVTEDIKGSSLETQYTFIRYIESKTGVMFLPERLDVPRFQAAVDELKAKREELRRGHDAGKAERPEA